MKKVLYTKEKAEFSIELSVDDNSMYVEVTKNGNKVGPTYTTTFRQAEELLAWTGTKAWDEFIKSAIADIESGRIS